MQTQKLFLLSVWQMIPTHITVISLLSTLNIKSNPLPTEFFKKDVWQNVINFMQDFMELSLF